jgi:two-component system, cell cycle sensor histidine kinase and response regulator CckA
MYTLPLIETRETPGYHLTQEAHVLSAARVLVVDDEQLCLDVTSRRLRREGYEVFPASGPRQALEIVKKNPLMDLVLSDIHMPEMRGTELVREIARISPRTASIFMTAFVLNPRDVPKGVALLKKPFSTQELIFAVQAALARSAEVSANLAASGQGSRHPRAKSKASGVS